MEQPATPCFAYNSRKHFLYLWNQIEMDKRVSRLTLVTQWDRHCTVYDPSGAAWNFRFEHNGKGYSWLDRVLAEIYNPAKEMPVVWSRIRSYETAELRSAYLEALAHDDDILTQFVEADELSDRIQRCQSFADLIATWQWMETDRDVAFIRKRPE